MKNNFINLEKYLRSQKYREQDYLAKENSLFTLFHINFWQFIDSSERHLLLEELENVLAIKQNRSPYKLVIKDNDFQHNDLIFDFCCNYNQKEFWVRKEMIEKGYGQIIQNGKIKIINKYQNALNMSLLHNILHEGYHATTNNFLDKNDFYLEHIEYLIFLNTISEKDYLKWNQEQIFNKIYKYKMIPDEFYAEKYSIINLVNHFQKLEKMYGYDYTFHSYCNYLDLNQMKDLNSFNNDYNLDFNYQEMYDYFLNSYIEKYCQIKNCSKESVEQILKKYKRYIN